MLPWSKGQERARSRPYARGANMDITASLIGFFGGYVVAVVVGALLIAMVTTLENQNKAQRH